MWCQKPIGHLPNAESMEDFPNIATRANLVDKLSQIRGAFVEVNSGSGKNLEDVLNKLSDLPTTRVLAAQTRQLLRERNR